MTSRVLATSGSNRARRAGGFTLIEVLVVVGIIAVLAGILVPVVASVRRKAQVARVRADLHTISAALEAYKADFGDYPRPEYSSVSTATTGYDVQRPNPPSGAEILCRALIGPCPAQENPAPGSVIPIQDGADGPGFRTRTFPLGTPPQGRTYGPYLAADKFKIGPVGAPTSTPLDPKIDGLRYVILDSNGQPILYFPGRFIMPPQTQYLAPLSSGSWPPTTAAMAAGKTYAYDINDNVLYFIRSSEGSSTLNAEKRIHTLLGDYNPDNATAATNFNGAIDPGETAASTGPYLLWDAGQDGNFGLDSVTPTRSDLAKCDDVTNFNGQ